MMRELADIQPNLQPKATLGARYELETCLGKGATGMVFLAYDCVLERQVAVKVISRGVAETHSQRLLRGARAVARIEHPNLVRVYDCGLDSVLGAYLVMERPRGASLASVLRERSRLNVMLVIELGRQLARGLEAMHAHNVIHRDVKPGNILVTTGPDHPHATLLDFGLTRALSTEPDLTQTHGLLGTWSYLAPERIRPQPEAAAAADVYGLGCVLYEMLTGAPPFREPTRAALLVAISHDAPDDLANQVQDAPPALSALVHACLKKDPRHRPTAAVVAQMLERMPCGVWDKPEPSWIGSALGQGELIVEASIGAGAHGEVFRVRDEAGGRCFAVKRARGMRPEQTDRLKREFRTLCDLNHPNIVRGYSLSIDEDDAYLVLELLDGRALEPRALRTISNVLSVFQQLSAGLSALHSAGFVHRDLKPAHVLLTAESRVVILDFSVAAPVGATASAAGTPPYRAPEAGRMTVSPGLDIYALGVLLQEVLEGTDSLLESASATHLSALAQACISADPETRPTAAQLATWLNALTPSGEQASSSTTCELVGRQAALDMLRQSCSPSRALEVIVVSGQSGIGKSTLIDALRDHLGSEVLVCSATCRPSESIPFAAIDAAIDALCDALERNPELAGSEPLPNAGALMRLLPAFGRLSWIRRSAQWQRQGVYDASEAFGMAHDALRNLLVRICERRRVVFVLDDLHWMDERTAVLLTYILRRPDPPALTLIATRRPASEADAPALDAMLERFPARKLEVGPLSRSESRELIVSLGGSPSRADTWFDFTEGHPLYLVRLALNPGREAQPSAALHDALRAEIAALAPELRCLLQLLSLAAEPLPRATACELSHSSAEHVFMLLARRLVRRQTRDDQQRIAPYHAHVAAAALSLLSDDEQRALHRLLAGRVALGPTAVEHLARSGAVHAAAKLAEQLAVEAERSQQDLLAAQLYAAAARHCAMQHRISYLTLQANALHRAGQSGQAARVLAAALDIASEDRAATLRTRVGTLKLLSGDVSGGVTVLADTLLEYGISLAGDVAEVITQTSLAYQALSERGLAWTSNERPSGRLCEVLDLTLSLAQGLSHVDLRALPLAFKALQLALDLGEPERLLRASAIFVWNTASHFPNSLIGDVLTLCRALCDCHQSSYATALLHLAQAEQLHFQASFSAAELEWEAAEHLLTTDCAGVARELAGVRGGLAFLQYAHKGDFRTWLAETQRWQADAQLRQDLYHLNMLRSAHALVWIAQDDPERARRELALAEAEWPGGISVFEVSVVLFLDVCDRYQGRAHAHLYPAQGRETVLRSPASQTPFFRGYLLLHQAWGAISALARASELQPERAMAEAAVKEMRTLGLPIWQHVADAMEANLKWLAHEHSTALALLRKSELGLRSLSMLCLSACARRRRAEFMTGAGGARVKRDAESQLRALGVVRVDTWCRAYFSMFEVSTVHVQTLMGEA